MENNFVLLLSCSNIKHEFELYVHNSSYKVQGFVEEFTRSKVR